MTGSRPPWPAHRRAVRPWRSSVRGDRADRLTTTVTVSIPPSIAAARWEPDADTAVLLARSTLALRALDEARGAVPLHRLLARSEAVATSQIEHEKATVDDVARAVVGSRANPSASAMVDAGDALERLVDAAGRGRLDERALLDAHHRLMRHDPVDGRHAGRYRSVQNWVGGGRTPRDADHVPPPPDLVPPLMADLFAFLARDDLHPVAQAAIAHAQFESIHPFTDGNGRTGRALVAAVLRSRGLTQAVSAPVATVLVAERSRYFAHLAQYRDGAVDEWVRDLAIAIGAVSDEGIVTGMLLDELADERAATTCASGAHAVLGRALEHDALLTEERAEDLLRRATLTGTPPGATAHRADTVHGGVRSGMLSGVHGGVRGGALSGAHGGSLTGVLDDTVADLCRAGVLRPVTTRRRRRAWVAPAVVAELDAFSERVRDGVEARAHRLAG